ncbi:MAG: hypothetical protein K2J11_00030 [Oscillospiraceae bacterium]|nr:hypothetical protein [Oscillospiraceae bacterium]
MMKRHKKSVIAAAMAMLLLSACGKETLEDNFETLSSISAASLGTHIENAERYSENVSVKTASAEQTKKGNILIAYFSRWGNTEYPDDVDATTSASIVADGSKRYGTTEYAANFIKKTVGGDLHRIETVTPYTADFDELRDVNHSEMQQGFLPELKESGLDISAYDTVFIGYPVWATSVPQAVVSFMNKYDLSDKTVIPFCTHDGYGAGNSYREVAEASGAAITLDGIAIEAKDVPNAQEEIADWLKKIGIPVAARQTETDIHITIGDTVLDGVLYDTALADEIKAYFPLTISMVGYGGREYYGGVDFYPQNLEGGQKNFENGDITYCEAHHNMAIFYAQTDNPNLSVDVIPIGRVTSDLSFFENLSGSEKVTFSLAE